MPTIANQHHLQPIGAPNISMNNSDSASDNPSPRPTLKLKVAPRQPPIETKSTPASKSPSKTTQKPGAQWSDDDKRKMQEDMDQVIRPRSPNRRAG